MRRLWRGVAGVAFALGLATAGAQQPEDGAAGALRGGGRVSAVSQAAGLLTVDHTTLRLDAGTRVYDYGGERVPASALEIGMSVSYVADAPAPPPEPPAVREVRMVPN